MPHYSVKEELSSWLRDLKVDPGRSWVRESLWPADGHSSDECGGWCCARREVADIEVGQWVFCVAIHGAICAIHVLVNHPWNELWRERDDECLQGSTKSETCIIIIVILLLEHQLNPTNPTALSQNFFYSDNMKSVIIFTLHIDKLDTLSSLEIVYFYCDEALIDQTHLQMGIWSQKR